MTPPRPIQAFPAPARTDRHHTAQEAKNGQIVSVSWLNGSLMQPAPVARIRQTMMKSRARMQESGANVSNSTKRVLSFVRLYV